MYTFDAYGESAGTSMVVYDMKVIGAGAGRFAGGAAAGALLNVGTAKLAGKIMDGGLPERGKLSRLLIDAAIGSVAAGATFKAAEMAEVTGADEIAAGAFLGAVGPSVVAVGQRWIAKMRGDASDAGTDAEADVDLDAGDVADSLGL